MILGIIIGFSVGCVLTWLSMMNLADSSYTAGYAQGFHDASTRKVNDAE